jgi:hypothetical protein
MADIPASVIAAIESIVGDDFCADLECGIEFATDEEKLSPLWPQLKQAADKIGRVYCIAHGWNPNHTCYLRHEDWRNMAEIEAPTKDH